MGIFTRFRDIVSANINAMLDRAEDPEKMIKLMIREMEDTLIELKSSCAGAIAGRKKLERKLAEIEERRDTWAERAELAVSKGRDDLAREALLEKRRFAEVAEALEKEVAGHEELIGQYQSDIRELEDKLNHAKEKKRMLLARHRRAQNSKRAREDVRRVDSVEAMARFDHLESRIERMEAEADMVNYGRQESGDSAFDTLKSDDEIEKELAKLKSAAYRAEGDQ